MKHFLLVFFLFFSFGSSWALDTIELKGGDLGSGKIYIPCALEGQKKHCFFDSGSDTSSVRSPGLEKDPVS